MKIYEGITAANGDKEVWVDCQTPGCESYRLPLYLDEVNHSPDGFNWGYGGSGPSQLAYAMLRDLSGDRDFAARHYQDFKWQVICDLPDKEWQLAESTIMSALNRLAQGATAQ